VSKLKVLIVEDNLLDAELMVRALKGVGIDFDWERVDTESDFLAYPLPNVDLILSDYGLPQFSGGEALRIVRSRGLDTPFILVSGSIGEDIAVAAIHGGADDYLLKDRIARLGPAVLQVLEKHRLQHENRRVLASLMESEERFRQITENIREVFWLTDAAGGKLLYVSPGYDLIWGRSGDELRTSPRLWLEAVHADDRDRVRQAVLNRHTASAHDLQYRIVRPDGSVRWIHDRAFPVPDASGNIYRVAGVADDVTEQHQAQTKIHGLNRVYAMLSGINNAIARLTDRQQLYEEACRIAVEHGHFGIAWIGQYDAARMEIVPAAAAGLDSDSFLRHSAVSLRPEAIGEANVAPRAFYERRPVFDNDIAASSNPGQRRREAIRRGYRSVIGLPLTIEGEVLGTFSLFARERGFFDAEEVSLLTELAANISFGLSHIAHQRKLEKLSRVRMVSGNINAAIVRIRDREALLNETCRIAFHHGRFPMVWVGEVDAACESIRPVAEAGFPHGAPPVTWSGLSTGNDVLSEALRTGTRAMREDIGDDDENSLTRTAMQYGCLSAVSLPLRAEGRISALLVLFASGRGFFDAEELDLLDEVSADVSFALQSISEREKVEYLSYYDSLTGLPNRALFVDRAQNQTQARGGEQVFIALLLLNIERFRHINESFGRHGGDQLLRLVAQRLESALRGKEHLARIGADGFGIMLCGMRDSAGVVRAVEEQVLSCFDEPFTINETVVRVAAKAGIALYPSDAEQADVLFNNAEAALKRARTTGERHLFYAADMNAQAAQLLSLETRLRAAVRKGQFVLHYQPKYELASGRICGMEALMRWQDPDKGLVPPGEFIPLLEETGLILEAGSWALRQALADHRALRDCGLTPPRIAVNVSAIQLRRKDFARIVIDALQAQGDDSEALELEITESLLMQDVKASTGALSVLRGTGIRIAMDDFGTGYSSLSYLARLPIDSLKIDRSFINAMNTSDQDMSIVSTIMALAHALELRVVAEGVETEDQARSLRRLDCDEAQGYFFSRPIPFEAITSMLAPQRGSTPPLIGHSGCEGIQDAGIPKPLTRTA
jgi:diguanylate cyclase (GGDEF)-like protein/PAS domain S-box-containing protein